MKDVLAILLMVVYNLTILGGTVYLIQFYEWNPWWILLAVLICVNYKTRKE